MWQTHGKLNLRGVKYRAEPLDLLSGLVDAVWLYSKGLSRKEISITFLLSMSAPSLAIYHDA